VFFSWSHDDFASPQRGLLVYMYIYNLYIWRVQHCTRRTHITSTQISTAGPRFIVLVKQIGSARMFYVIVRNAAEISPITIIITIELHKLQKNNNNNNNKNRRIIVERDYLVSPPSTPTTLPRNGKIPTRRDDRRRVT